MQVIDDVHNHRRHGDTDDMTGHRLEAAIESTAAKGITRFVVPLLLAAIGVLGGFGFNSIKSDIADVKTMQTTQGKAQTAQGEDIFLIKSDVRDVNTILSARVIRQVESDTKRIDNHEERIQTLERSVRTP